jgi:hypothetical protein
MYLYRYVDDLYDYRGPRIKEQKFKIIKETPKGYWISKEYQDRSIFGVINTLSDNKKWIGKNTQRHRKFAFESKEDAMRSYRYRKAAQLRILRQRVKYAEQLFEKAKEKDETYDPKRDWHWGIDEPIRVYHVKKRWEDPRNFIKIEDFSL